MFKLQVAHYCEDCEDFEPKVEKLYKDDHVYITCISCEYEHRCENIFKMAMKLVDEKEKNDGRV